MHNLVHALIRDPELLRKFSLRDASCMLGADDDMTFAGGEGWIRQQGVRIELFEE